MIILNAYYNKLLIPERLVHSSAKVGLKILIALLEGAILVSIAYAVNRGVLSDTGDKVNGKAIANRSGKIQLIITVCFIIAVILS